MNQPLINILIRISRPELFERCIESVKAQTYTNYRVIATVDNNDARDQVDDTNIDMVIDVNYHKNIPFFYNEYINDMMAFVSTGWVLVLDDDDILATPEALASIAPYLTNPDQPIICQMLRKGMPKPADIYMDKQWIMAGHIGMPCMIMPVKHKDVYKFEAREDADFKWIVEVSKAAKPRFVKMVVVDVGRRSHGVTDAVTM